MINFAIMKDNKTEEVMVQEAIQPGTLLKAKDGSEYVVFKYYLDSQKHKCDTPTDTFNGSYIGKENTYTRKKIEDYRLADKAEIELLERLNSLIDKAEKLDMERTRLYYEAEAKKLALDSRQKSLDELPNRIKGVENAITALLANIKEAAKLTGQASVRGEVVCKELNDIIKKVQKLLYIESYSPF